MKKFPHQTSSRAKLRQALEAIEDLIQAGLDVGDDGILGYELASRGVYTFRGLRFPTATQLNQRIAHEQKQPPSQQGARTAAREIRRTLRDLGFLTDSPQWSLTPAGRSLLATTPGSTQEQAVWQRALLALAVTDDAGTSHPVRILLRLVQQDAQLLGPGRKGMELALEAQDDSQSEYQRIRQLLRRDFDDRIAEIGVSSHSAANAVKILPALAEGAGLIAFDRATDRWTLTQAGLSALTGNVLPVGTGSPPRVTPRATRKRTQGRLKPRQTRSALLTAKRRVFRMRQVNAANVAPAIDVNPEGWASVAHADQVKAVLKRTSRTNRHQEMVTSLARYLDKGRAEFRVGQGDLLVLPTDVRLDALLFEVKTVEEGDALTQVLKSTSQLTFYEFRLIRDKQLPGRTISKVSVFETAIEDLLGEYLDSVGIAAFHWDGKSLTPLNQAAQAIVRLIREIRGQDQP